MWLLDRIDRSAGEVWIAGQAILNANNKAFIAFYRIDMGTFEPSDPESYLYFDGFFLRRFALTARPIFVLGHTLWPFSTLLSPDTHGFNFILASYELIEP